MEEPASHCLVQWQQLPLESGFWLTYVQHCLPLVPRIDVVVVKYSIIVVWWKLIVSSEFRSCFIIALSVLVPVLKPTNFIHATASSCHIIFRGYHGHTQSSCHFITIKFSFPLVLPSSMLQKSIVGEHSPEYFCASLAVTSKILIYLHGLLLGPPFSKLSFIAIFI